MSDNGPRVTLQFDPNNLTVGDDKDIREGLSAVAPHGTDLWLACDEGCRLERLTRTTSERTFSSHRAFPLADFLELPAKRKKGKPEAEADIEGMDIDEGWLWLVGSHSVKRKNAKKGDAPSEIAEKLGKISRDGNRHLLARIPLEGGLPKNSTGTRQAGCIDTSTDSSALLEAIKASDDRLLLPFVPLPGKDNGLDIEGLAVRGMRAFVGLRGPVLRGWSCILELRLEDQGHTLKLLPVEGAVPYRKHFQNLGNLGVRDLLILGDDLFVLAGPPQSHDGPHEVWRWRGGAKAGAVASDFRRVLTLPQREGVDRAEGFALLEEGDAATSILVVYDTPAEERLAGHEGSVTADVFRLP